MVENKGKSMQKDLAKSATILTGFQIAVMGLGVLSSVILAYYFGAGKITDAFFLAQSIPLIFAKLLQTGPFSKVFLPLYSKGTFRGETVTLQARQVAYNIFNVFAVIFLGVSLFLALIAPFLVRLMAPGFDGETQQLATRLTIFMVFTLWLTICDEFFTAILHTSNRFLGAACLQLVTPLAVCVSLIWGAKRWGIYSATYGVLIGSVLQAFCLYILVARRGLTYHFYFNLKQPELRQLFSGLAPFSILGVIAQVQQIVFRIIASLIGPGAIAVLGYAEKFYHTIANLFSATLTTVLFPSFVHEIHRERLEEVKRLLGRGIRLLSFLLLPVIVGLIVVREPFIRLLFERGSFDDVATRKTALALSLLLLGLFPICISNLLSRILFAFQKPHLVVLGNTSAQVILIVTHLLLGIPFGIAGLSLSLALNGYFLLLLYGSFVNPKLPGGFMHMLVDMNQRRITYAALLMGIICLLTLHVPMPLFIVIAVGIVSYLVSSYYLRIEELGLLGGLLRLKRESLATHHQEARV